MTTQRLRFASFAALLASSLLAAGCGGDDKDKVQDSFKDLAAAAKDKDAEKFCGLLSKDALDSVKKEAKEECKDAFDKQSLDALAKEAPDPNKIKFDKVTVKDDKATLKVKGESSETKMVKEDGDWKVTP